MKQPTKDALREQLALAATEIIRLRDDLAHWKAWESVIVATARAEAEKKRPWWCRWFA